MTVTSKTFRQQFAQLTDQERTVVRLKALIFSADNKATFRDCLSLVGIRDRDGRRFTHAALNLILDGLRHKGFLTNSYLIKRKIAHPATVSACDAEDAERMISAVGQTYEQAFQHDYRYQYSYRYSYAYGKPEDFLRTLRIAIYRDDAEVFEDQLEKLSSEGGDYLNTHDLVEFVTTTTFDLDWLKTRNPAIQRFLFENRVYRFLTSGLRPKGWSGWLAHYRIQQHEPEFEDLRDPLTQIEFQAGDFAAVEAKLKDFGDLEETAVQVLGLRGCVAFCRGADPEALELFHGALKLLKKQTRRRKIFLPGPAGKLFLLALLRSRTAADLKTAEQGLASVRDSDSFAYAALEAVLALMRGQDAEARRLLEGFDSLDLDTHLDQGSHLDRALIALAHYLVNPDNISEHQAQFADSFESAKEILPLVARIFADILAEVAIHPGPYITYLADTHDLGVRSFANLLQLAPRWERGLDNLAGFFDEPAKKARQSSKGSGNRLAWLVDPDTREITPIQQTLGKRGAWSKGRPVALKRLHRLDPKLDFLTDRDRAVATAIRKESYGWYRSTEQYYFDDDKAWLALTGNPCVFHAAEPDRPLELVAALPELEVERAGADYRVKLSHAADAPQAVVEAETPTRYRVVDVSKRMVQLGGILGEHGMKVPAAARDRLLAVLEKASASLPVHSDDLAGRGAAAAGDATPRVQLQPLDGGLKVGLRVRPFGAAGPDYPVGRGAGSVMATVAGKAARVSRDLALEAKLAEDLLASAATLRANYDGGFEWILEDLETCLELLGELAQVPAAAIVEWPEGSRLAVTSTLDGQAAAFRIGSAGDWFKLAGEIKVDEGRVVERRALLDGLDQAQGRFVPLGDGRFLALTNHFKAELDRLRRLGETTKDGLRFHGLGALAMRDLLDGVGTVKGNRKWNAHLERIDGIDRLEPVLPATIQAELREYQVAGFTWLTRLAHWGVGACLADDMGVGKTLQALSVMAGLAAEGPCLVVAPTSVCHNWVAEIDRFAPTLNAIVLNYATDRTAMLAALGPMDVLICSYGLLVRDAEALCRISWRIAVLDEAQAIKNATTRRARAAFALEAGFKLALTGTPIENNLGELWSLFNFINPGLLGTEKSFQKRLLSPVGDGAGNQARQALKALIRPFILRRTKSLVLSELPPKIEQTLNIEMEPEEAAFYESLRRRAVETLSGLDEAAAGRRKIHILAEITRLRRACCHAALVDSGWIGGGAKLNAFLELVDELRQNRHRALVFSQYVGFLDLVRSALDRKGVAYQYLDGSTPVREREKRVAAFQSGAGDLFLISLKAGGAGLNLTAADYVVHLDPWWNPAVEDQASDRAHRIGQHRPVTIYRLIMAGTIEQRIIGLHRDKRDLAADLLAGAEVAGRLSEEDLMGLLESAEPGI